MQFPVDGIYETHLPVSDLARSVEFYRDRLGLEPATPVPARNAAFFWVGGKARGMLGLWGTGSGPLQMKLHFAFRLPVAALLAAPRRLEAAGIAPLGFHGGPVTEPVVIGWMPALSLYFRDPDEHSLEFIAVLGDPPDPGFGIGPYSDWCARGRPAGANGSARQPD